MDIEIRSDHFYCLIFKIYERTFLINVDEKSGRLKASTPSFSFFDSRQSLLRHAIHNTLQQNKHCLAQCLGNGVMIEIVRVC